jgi:MOSC domain-containing protein YiiM
VRLVTVNVGGAGAVPHRGRAMATAIDKRPVVGPVGVGPLGLEGDTQVDRRHHGGPDKALCAYPSEHLPGWSERLRRDLRPGAFGENLSTVGVTEDDACIGDQWRVGSTLLEISYPRTPCVKLAARHRHPHLIRLVRETGRSGWYLRVLEPGTLAAGDAVERVLRPDPAVSLVEVNAMLRGDGDVRGTARRLQDVAAAPVAWRLALAEAHPARPPVRG